jgi:DNA mismatch repair protein MutL
MSRIQILPPEVAEKIAAGEVIERPASVVKELVENALDAGAQRVTVETEGGGKVLIRVTDDGGGMTPEEARLALYRHATSKLRSAADLFDIHTLGFRGEAIPSIAAVSEMEILTRTPEAAEGTRILVRAGEVLLEEPAAAPVGTRITVRELFYNVPVREKFLRSDVAEAGHVTDWLQRLALSRPDVGFRLTHDGREALLSPGSRDPLNAVVAVLGRNVARDLLPVRGERDGYTVTGFVGRPTLTRANRALQHTYVNGRAVRTPLVYRALDDAFRSTMPSGRRPVAVLFLTVPPDAVDVNVHPAKTEIRFQDEAAAHLAVREALAAALAGLPADETPELMVPPREARPPLPAPNGPAVGPSLRVADQPTAAPRYQTPDLPTPPPPPRRIEPLLMPADPHPAALPRPDLGAAASAPREEAAPPAPGLPEFSYLGQSQDLFILALGGGRLWVIDQHVAHERVLFDRLTAADGGREPAEPLLFPAHLVLDRARSLALGEHRSLLAELGFEVEATGADGWTLSAVPRSLLGRNYEAVFRDLADELAEQSQGGRVRLRRDEVAAAAAGRSCKSAVKAGRRLDPDEVRRLLADLRAARNPHTCPHGRPVFVTYSPAEIGRLFGSQSCAGKSTPEV